MIINEGGSGGKKLPILTNPGAAGDLLENKQLIDANGNILTGTMPTVDHPNPTISVGANGLITASHAQGSGKVTGGTTTATRQLTTQGGTTITPGTTQKTAVASGRYTTGPVYVAGSSNLVASNIKSGVNIFGVTGTYSPSSVPAVVTAIGNGSQLLQADYLDYEKYKYLLNCTHLMFFSPQQINSPGICSGYTDTSGTPSSENRYIWSLGTTINFTSGDICGSTNEWSPSGYPVISVFFSLTNFGGSARFQSGATYYIVGCA